MLLHPCRLLQDIQFCLQKKIFTTSASLQFAQAMKGWGSRNRGVPPAKGSVGKFAGGKAASKVPAAGKAAAKVPAGKGAAGKAASAGAAHERLRVKCGRVIGKVVRWRGQEGWIRDSVHMVVTWGLGKDGAKSSTF